MPSATASTLARTRHGKDQIIAEKPPPKKLHHFVPQAYLRGFATEKERITAVPLSGDKSFTTGVRNVAAQTHFHRIEDLEQPDQVEDLLADVEGAAQTVIRKLSEGGAFPLSLEDRVSLAYFIALQAVRGPDTRRTSEAVQAAITRMEVGAGGRKNIGAWIKKNLGIENPTEEQKERIWNEATQPGGPPIKFSNRAHIENMVKTADDMMPYISSRPWSLVRFTKRSLITSDSPVSLIRNPRDDDGFLGVGFGTAWGITFPLTRKLGLLMGDPTPMLTPYEADSEKIQEIGDAFRAGKGDGAQTGTTAMEKLFNDHTAGGAREYIYHHPDDERFVPDELPEPRLVNMEMSGMSEAEFTGEPWFGPDSTETDD